MGRRALQQGDIIKTHIPSFNKISNPSVQNYCIRHPVCIHTHTEKLPKQPPQASPQQSNILSSFSTFDFQQHIYIYSADFSIRKNWKRGDLIQADTEEKRRIWALILQMTVMLLHTAYAPPYTRQEQLPTPLTLRKEFRCHGATSAALWYKRSESASRFPPARRDNSWSTNEWTHGQVGQPCTWPHIQVRS